MNDQDLPPIIYAEEPSDESKRTNEIFDDIELKQLETLDTAARGLIERIATFLGVLFGLTILNNTFPPAYLKGHLVEKILIIISLVCFLGAIAAAIRVTQVRSYRRYTYNVSRNNRELKRMLAHKLRWSGLGNLFFALGTIALAGLLIVIIWNI